MSVKESVVSDLNDLKSKADWVRLWMNLVAFATPIFLWFAIVPMFFDKVSNDDLVASWGFVVAVLSAIGLVYGVNKHFKRLHESLDVTMNEVDRILAMRQNGTARADIINEIYSNPRHKRYGQFWLGILDTSIAQHEQSVVVARSTRRGDDCP